MTRSGITLDIDSVAMAAIWTLPAGVVQNTAVDFIVRRAGGIANRIGGIMDYDIDQLVVAAGEDDSRTAWYRYGRTTRLRRDANRIGTHHLKTPMQGVMTH